MRVFGIFQGLFAPEGESGPAGAPPVEDKVDTGNDAGDEGDESDESAGEVDDNEDLEESDEGDGLEENQVKEARALYKLLNDPKTRIQTLTALSRASGLDKAETKKEVTAAKKDLKEIVKTALGDEYAFLSEKLSTAFEQVLESERASNTEVLNRLQANQLEAETNTALERLSSETKGQSKKLENKMIALMDEILPAPGLSTYQYLKNLYRIAASDNSAASATSRMADKIRRNSRDAASRMHSVGRTSDNGKLPAAPAKKGVAAAVQHAIAQLEKDSK